jgi:putative nucleotidyltransferase with HDIG domain
MTRILFVDDEVKILEGLKRMMWLQRREWEMAFAPGGKAALSMLEACAFDVIVSDMRMPEIDGAALLEIAREKYPNTLRFILSGYTELEASYRAVPVAHQFLLKPCDPDALRSAIQRATSLVTVLNSKLLASLVGSIRDLPSLPRTCAELRQVLSDPDVSISQVARVVERDVGISAKVLQLVNSAFFGVTREVADIKTAISYLGIMLLQNLVLSVEMFRVFQPKKAIPGFSMEEFHEHSQLTAQIASGIGRTLGLSDAVVAAALLHDVGKLVIAEKSPEHFARAIAGMRQDKKPLFSIEEDLIGVSHAEVGAYLLSIWGLPAPVVEAVAFHHHPERVPQEKPDMVSAVYLSNLLAHQHAGKQEDITVEQDVHPQILAIPGISEKLPEWRELAETIAHEPERQGVAGSKV